MASLAATKPSGKAWRKGGMTSNGLRSSGVVWNYFGSPGRQSIQADAPTDAFQSKAFTNRITSIGQMQSNGLRRITSGTYGPGTLLSTNIQVFNSQPLTEAQLGAISKMKNVQHL
jgi:hypothetical protein